MPLVSEEKTVEFLKPHLGAIRKIVQGGWDDYLNLYDEALRVVHCSTTRAAIVHSHQIERASHYSQVADNVRLFDLSKLKILVIDGQFAIRFKKFDEEKRSANQPTKQVEEFRSQGQLPGLPMTYNLEAGYVLDKLATKIEQIHLVCPNRKGFYWAAELHEDMATQTIFDLYDYRNAPEEEIQEEKSVGIKPKQDGITLPFRRESDES